MRVRVHLLCLLGGTLVLAVPGQALARGGDRDCQKVSAKTVGEDHLTSETTGRTVVRVSHDRLLRGSAVGNHAIIGAMPPILDTTRTVVFTTKRGTLTVDTTGTFHLDTGESINSGSVTGGTGRFAGATGWLGFHGFEERTPGPTMGYLTETVKGSICLAEKDDDQ